MFNCIIVNIVYSTAFSRIYLFPKESVEINKARISSRIIAT